MLLRAFSWLYAQGSFLVVQRAYFLALCWGWGRDHMRCWEMNQSSCRVRTAPVPMCRQSPSFQNPDVKAQALLGLKIKAACLGLHLTQEPLSPANPGSFLGSGRTELKSEARNGVYQGEKVTGSSESRASLSTHVVIPALIPDPSGRNPARGAERKERLFFQAQRSRCKHLDPFPGTGAARKPACCFDRAPSACLPLSLFD